uniref:ZP domain-containing protein n=1 Tax=Ciona savignyi TaxID=51511 RepID=H2YRJ3_CIOSA
MTMYRDSSYTTGSLISSSPTIAEGEILYVAVDLVALSITNQQNEVLVLDRCYATDTTAQRRHIYDFIINGCPSNPAFTLVMENGQSAQAKWAFRVFEWAVQSVTSDVFIVCKVSVCDTGYEACLPTCGSTITPTPPQ